MTFSGWARGIWPRIGMTQQVNRPPMNLDYFHTKHTGLNAKRTIPLGRGERVTPNPAHCGYSTSPSGGYSDCMSVGVELFLCAWTMWHVTQTFSGSISQIESRTTFSSSGVNFLLPKDWATFSCSLPGP